LVAVVETLSPVGSQLRAFVRRCRHARRLLNDVPKSCLSIASVIRCSYGQRLTHLFVPVHELSFAVVDAPDDRRMTSRQVVSKTPTLSRSYQMPCRALVIICRCGQDSLVCCFLFANLRSLSSMYPMSHVDDVNTFILVRDDLLMHTMVVHCNCGRVAFTS
jgi:hypothetical protein